MNVLAQVTIGVRYRNAEDPELLIIEDGWDDFFVKGSPALLVGDGKFCFIVPYFFSTSFYQSSVLFPWIVHIPPMRSIANIIRRGIGNVSMLQM